MSPATSRPLVLLLTMGQWYHSISFEELEVQLAAKANLKRIYTAADFFAAPPPAVIIIGDEGIADGKHASALTRVQEYTRAGCRTIVAGIFSSFMSPDGFNRFFTSWSVSWRSGSYDRTDISLNQSCAQRFGLKDLPLEFSVKALKAQGADPRDRLYAPSINARTQSLVFLPDKVDQTHAAVTYTSWGNGILAYVGDVNMESNSVIVAMCRLEI